MQNPTPTRTRDTEKKYLKRSTEIIERIGENLGKTADKVGCDDICAWLESNRERWTANTFRQYRSALSFRFGLVNPAHGQAIAAVSQLGLAVKPKHGHTSSMKKKHIPPARAQRLLKELRKTGGEWESLAADVFEATVRVGLRPCEWNTAELRGKTLIVQNAKATNGRGSGKERHIEVPAGSFSIVQRVLSTLNSLPENVDWYTQTRVAFRSVRMELYPKSQYTLYTARHQFSANTKAACSREEVAKRMGHRSIRTAARHYGKRRSGWRIASNEQTQQGI